MSFINRILSSLIVASGIGSVNAYALTTTTDADIPGPDDGNYSITMDAGECVGETNNGLEVITSVHTLVETYTSDTGTQITNSYGVPCGGGNQSFSSKVTGSYEYVRKSIVEHANSNGYAGKVIDYSNFVTVDVDNSSGLPSVTEPLNFENYDIYYGDFNGDDIGGDIYLHGKDIFVLIASAIDIPLLLDGPKGVVFHRNGSGYDAPQGLDLLTDQLDAFTKAEVNEDFYWGDLNADGIDDLVVRGATGGLPSAGILAVTQASYPVAEPLNLQGVDFSNRNLNFLVEDRTGDGRADIVYVGDSYNADWIFVMPASGSVQEITAPIYNESPNYLEANLVGSSDGQFRVDERGAASYMFPISLPAGTAGVVPEVNLAYSSVAGNGLMGRGWNLAAYSSIQNCVKTLVVDGESKPLILDSSSSGTFCLDGQRLIADGSSGYLRTEIDSYKRVKQTDTYTFTVEGKDGSIKIYGGSQAQVQFTNYNGAGKILKWALSKACDSVGNCIDYEYDYDNDGSNFRLSQINYAYGSGSQANAVVYFDYEDRLDITNQYVSGHHLTHSKRLKAIRVENNENSAGLTELRRYNMHYLRQSPNDLYPHSYLDGIQECVETDCLPATNFTWSRAQGSQFGAPVWEDQVLFDRGVSFLGDVIPMDINGDGHQDMAWVEIDSTHGGQMNGLVRYALYDASTQSYIQKKYEGKQAGGTDPETGEYLDYPDFYQYVSGDPHDINTDRGRVSIQPLDYNADGRMDLAIYTNAAQEWRIHLAVQSASGGWALDHTRITISNISLDNVLFEANSDGLMDILTYDKVRYLSESGASDVTPYAYSTERNVTWNYTSRAFSPDLSAPTGGYILEANQYKDLMNIGDLNGDGIGDVLLIDRRYNYFDGSHPATTEICARIQENYYAMVYAGVDASTNRVIFDEYAYLGRHELDDLDENECGLTNDRGPAENIIPVDLNRDGYTDIALFSGLTFKYYFNSGEGFVGLSTDSNGQLLGGAALATFTEKDHAEETYINFVDMNGDGYGDFLVQEKLENIPYATGSHSLRYQTWSNTTNSFDGTWKFAKVTDTSYYNDERHLFVDATGDGYLDHVRFYDGYKLELRPNTNTGLDGFITNITNGLGANTAINYSRLAETDHYRSLEDIATAKGSDFYDVLRNPFNSVVTEPQTFVDDYPAPVMEYFAPLYVVTEVVGDAPSANSAFGNYTVDPNSTVTMEYYYAAARLQAGGRGFLGFQSVASRDPQSQVTVETRYRQDWPFVGYPHSTITYAPSTQTLVSGMAGVAVQSVKYDQWKLVGWNNTWGASLDDGSIDLGPLKPYLARSEEVVFNFNTNKANPTQIVPAPSTATGDVCDDYTDSEACGLLTQIGTQKVLQYNVTLQTYDNENNPTTIQAITQGAGLKQTKTTTNCYGTSDCYSGASSISFDSVAGYTRNSTSYKQLGRLTSATVGTIQERIAGQPSPEVSKTSTFTYYNSGAEAGLLESETVFDDEGVEYELTTSYDYDEFGNKNKVSTTGQKIAYLHSGTMPGAGISQTRTARTEYDSTGRYVDRTYQNFGPNSAGLFADGNGDVLIEEITARDVNGAPLIIRTDLSAAVSTFDYDVLGREILSSSNVNASDGTGNGSWTETYYLSCSSELNCPLTTAMVVETLSADGSKSRAYMDILGRTIRQATTGFDGSWIYVDTQFDNSGRSLRASEPYTSSPTFWSETKYDVLGRAIQTRSPNGNLDTFAYGGYRTIAKNTLGHFKIETRNGFGELIEVEDDLGGRIEYLYNGQGHMTTVNKYASANRSAQKVVDYNSLIDFVDNSESDAYLTGSRSIVTTTLDYDALGRKTMMNDPDKGTWEYKYNAFGELLWQRDGKGQVVIQSYDMQGRLVLRTDYKADASVESHTRTFYDGFRDDGSFVSNAVGQVSAAVTTDNHSSAVQVCNLANGAQHCSYSNYDSFGRVSSSTVSLFAENTSKGTYTTETTYDELGRVLRSYDALSDTVSDGQSLIKSGVENVYSVTTGELTEIKDIATGEMVYRVNAKNVRGQVESVLFGNGITTNFDYYDDTGLLEEKHGFVGNTEIHKLSYEWTAVGNLEARNNWTKGLFEDFCYDNLNRLTRAYVASVGNGCGATPASQIDVNEMTYDSFGNLRKKIQNRYSGGQLTQTGFNSYQYGVTTNGYTQIAGPHAVTQTVEVGGETVRYNYDANGNMKSDESGRSLVYTTFDKPELITKGDHTTQFAYGPSRSRYWRKDTTAVTGQANQVTETLYLGDVERVTQGSKVIWKRYVAGMAIFEEETDLSNVLVTNTQTSETYIHKDHLGSTDVLTDSNGIVMENMSFNEWGERRNPANHKDYTTAEMIALLDADPNNRGAYSVHSFSEKGRTNKGFTGHEMLDEVGLVHMNGRIYDAKLGRFMQADPYIQASTNTQSYNRYSYVFNNPLSATDPSGFISSFFAGLKRDIGLVITVVAAIICQSCALSIAPITAGVSAAVNGADGFGVLMAIVSSMMMPSALEGVSHLADKVMVSGLLGGMTSVISGGDFGHGFISSGIGAYVGGAPGLQGADMAFARVVAGGIAGGTISELTGGKFKNGAASGAFSALIHESAAYGMSDEFKSNSDVENGWSESVQEFGAEEVSISLSDELTLDVSVSGSKGFARKVRNMLSKIERSDAGNKMLTGIAESGQELKIFETSELGSYATQRGMLDRKWAATTIAFNPKGIAVQFVYQNSKGDYLRANPTATYTLAHELYHAWQNTGWIFSGATPVPGRAVMGESPAEIHAVRYTNIIRREHGFGRVRTQYSIGGPINVDSY